MTQQLVRTQQGVKDRGGGKKSLGQGPLASIEAADVVALTGAVASSGALAATEATDTVALAGVVASADAASAVGGGGVLGFGPISAAPLGSIPALPPPELSQAAGAGGGAVLGFGPLGSAPLSAVAAFPPQVAAGIDGVLAATEAADTAAFAGEVAQPPVYGGGWLPKPRPGPVEGVGYGILPALEGEAHGVVVAVGTAVAVLHSLAGEAAGAARVGGQGAAHLTVKAAASGARGANGAAMAVLGLEVAGAGSTGVRGKAVGMIDGIEAVAVGRQDDDAAAIAWLLAA